MRSPSKRKRPTHLSRPRPVSVAGLVWRPARIVPRCSSCPPRYRIWRCCHRASPERKTRVLDMIAQMDKEGFGSCTSTGACEAVCPKEISINNIARLNAEYGRAGLIRRTNRRLSRIALLQGLPVFLYLCALIKFAA